MMNLESKAIIVLAVALLGATSLHAFSPIPATSPLARNLKAYEGSLVLASSKRDDDFPLEEKEEEYSGSVDWDAEWKKVVEKEKAGETIDRPGKEFYKSDAEIAAIRAANKAQTGVKKISEKLPSPPSMDMGSLTGDWRFWIGILALISVGSAVLSAQPSYTPISGGDSYYI